MGMPKVDPKLTPRAARTERQSLQLVRDNVETRDHWFLLDGDTVVIAAQRTGENVTEKVHLPRKTFEYFADFYNTGDARKRKPRK